MEVFPKDNYTLRIRFIDGSEKTYDMKPIIEKIPAFGALKDLEMFRRAHVERDTVAWDDMLDLAPESLYERGVLVER